MMNSRNKKARVLRCPADAVADLVAEAEDRGARSVAILTFYKAQKARIQRALEEQLDPVVETVADGYQVMSVDSAQGNEFDEVILSCVVDGHGRSFLQDDRRMNVALSRAKTRLTIVCHPNAARRLPALAAARTVASGGTVAIGRPVAMGRALGRGRGNGRGRGRGRGGGRGF